MNLDRFLEKLQKDRKTALNETDSKELLGAYGVPVVEETIVSNKDEAVKVAENIGFPVVLKGLGSAFSHKTEQGLVHTSLTSSEYVRNAAISIENRAGAELEGLLIQPQIEGKREFVMGLFQDELFGKVIMFGVGGVFTEAISDVTFRLIPLSETDANEMLEEIKAKALLGSFRGEKAVNRDQLIQTLLGLSRLAVQHPEVTEVDINPLIITPDGNICAVDALVILSKKSNDKRFMPSADPRLLGYFFHPRSLVFVGASAQIGKWGHTLFSITAGGGYGGEIYLVNQKGGSIAGRKVYKSVSEVPGNIDLAVVTIPVSGVMNLIPDLKNKGIKNMLLITSGFGETGKEGEEMEKNLVHAATEAGIMIVGPNTMGICNPHINLYCTGSHVRPRPGSTAMVSQSGNMGTQLLSFAEQQDIGIRGFCGSGNEAMVTIEDYLEAFEADDLTKNVMLYIESVKNGRRFFESALRVGKKKPIVLLKGGRSRAGSKAAASHTGALASDSRIFNAVCRQAGIVSVERPMDLLDLTAAFSSLPLPEGNRVAIMTLGGGWGVVTADLCSEYGLNVPDLPPELVAHIDKILPSYWSRSNPVDIVGERDFSVPMIIIEELLKWDGCDGVINLGILGRRIFFRRLAESIVKADPSYPQDFLEFAIASLDEFEEKYVDHVINLMEKYNKPVICVYLATGEKDKTVYRVEGSKFKGVFYTTPERAVKSFAKMYQYKRFLDRHLSD